MQENPQVSIIIVCMDKPYNLYPCLNSIRNTTTISYETLVVAYLFSPEHLLQAKKDFPWVSFIESNEIRGFSENNNLALKHAKGEFCFILNDDTELMMPTIDMLVESFNHCPTNTAIVSPTIVSPNGRDICGRPPMTWINQLQSFIHYWKETKQTEWINKDGLFKSYNILGAAFMIKTSIFKKMGWFDETYFFTPEDIALSTKLNIHGYECWVNNDAKVMHYEGMSGVSTSMIITCTKPAADLGELIFFSDGKWHRRMILTCVGILRTLAQYVYHSIKGCLPTQSNPNKILAKCNKNTFAIYFTRKTPKEIFTHYYLKLK